SNGRLFLFAFRFERDGFLCLFYVFCWCWNLRNKSTIKSENTREVFTMYGNPYIPTMPNVPQPFGYSPQNGLYNQPNNFTPNQFGQPQTGTQPQTSAGITVGQVATIEQVEQVQLMPGEKKIILVQNAPI